ncbi:unnamed protein product [Anisakis simplex]|uniref:Uncharacterized protein n=1 Tax=Anisakis simplex TaxID=6269 RepID=A0A0M3KHX3_ANISI|nr:unnamed protein product [Anisakis simplex]
MVVRKSLDESARSSTRSLARSFSKRWKFSRLTDRLHWNGRRAVSTVEAPSRSFFHSEFAINDLEQGSHRRRKNALSSRPGRKSASNMVRQASAMAVLDGHTNGGISAIYDPSIAFYSSQPCSRRQSRATIPSPYPTPPHSRRHSREGLRHLSQDVPLQRPTRLGSFHGQLSTELHSSQTPMKVLSTVEEEDPTNLTINNPEEMKRATLRDLGMSLPSVLSSEVNAICF